MIRHPEGNATLDLLLPPLLDGDFHLHLGPIGLQGGLVLPVPLLTAGQIRNFLHYYLEILIGTVNRVFRYLHLILLRFLRLLDIEHGG
jgi:hypothetical protein